MLWGILKSCGVPSRPPSLMVPVDGVELTGGRRRILSQGTMDTIAQSHRNRLNGRAVLFRELRRKTVSALRVDKEAYVRGICEGVEHHLWTGDSRLAYRGIRALRSSKPIPLSTADSSQGPVLLSNGNFVCALRVTFIVRFLYINNNGTVPHSTRLPLPTCFWLKAWAEPPSPQIEAPLQGRAWDISSSQ